MIPVGQRVTFHLIKPKSKIWARRESGGDWHPAQVVSVGKRKVRIIFESNGKRLEQHFADLALRNERKQGADKPAL